MHKFRTALSVVATTAMVLGTMGVAAAAGTTSSSSVNETRAEFVMQLDESLGISPVSPSTPTFTDVPASSQYYGYIEAAYQKGYISGFTATTFGPNQPITRAEAAKVLVEAYEGGNFKPTATSTTFTDNSMIPTALVGFVAEAKTLGLMKGFVNGSFGPNSNLTTAQEGDLVAQLKSVLASASFKVSASSTDVGVGQIVTLSSTGSGTVTYSVAGANASSALISGSSFVASAAGNYTVTGTTTGGQTASVTIGVYGAAVGLKISAPATVVANGASTTNVTVSVVDANGNVVAGNTDDITLTSTNTYAAGVSIGSASASGTAATQAVNGVATFVLTSGSVPGSSTTLTATDTTSGTTVANPLSTDYQASVSSTAQTATSLGVTGSQYLSVNGSGPSTTFDVQVLDQTGNAMLYGTYPFSASVSGPADFADGTTGPESYAYNGTGPTGTNEAAVTVDGLQGQTGAITLTVSGSGLKSGTGSVTAVISGSATAIQLTAPSTTSFAQGSASSEYTMSVVDAHGYPVSAPSGNVLVAITSGTTVENGTGGTFELYNAAGTAVISPAAAPTSSGTEYSYASLANGFTVFDSNATTGDAGSYSIQLTDESGNGLTASATSAFTETAATPKQVVLSGATDISAANPVDTITAQLEDQYGNNVSDAGAVISLTSAGPHTVTLSADQVTTNSSGAATFTASVPAYTVTGYSVSMTGATYNATTLTYSSTLDFAVTSTVATSIAINLTNVGTNYQNASSLAQAGDPVEAVVYAKDQYGNPVANDSITLTFGGTGTFVANPSSSTAELTSTSTATESTYTINSVSASGTVVYFYAYGAGNVTITGADNSAPGSVSGTADMTVLAQPTVSAFALYDASGNTASGEAVSANTPVTLTLKGTDLFGNYTYPTVAYAVYVGTSSSTGSFRLSTTGADVQTVEVPAGSSGVTVYYLDGTSGSPTFNTGEYVEIGTPNTTAGTVTLTPSGTVSSWSQTGANSSISSAGVLSFSGSGTATVTAVFTTGQTLTFTVNY